jgi:hypothetical protein
MGEVNDHSESIHLPHHIATDRGKTAVLGRFGLDVPEFVNPVVKKLQDSEPTVVEEPDA